jgi:hypothetical protein
MPCSSSVVKVMALKVSFLRLGRKEATKALPRGSQMRIDKIGMCMDAN